VADVEDVEGAEGDHRPAHARILPCSPAVAVSRDAAGEE
jgi:hypothetical protein